MSSGKVKANLILVTVDESGNIEDKEVFPNEQEEVNFMVKSSFYQKEDEKVLLLGNNPKEKKKRLMILDFK